MLFRTIVVDPPWLPTLGSTWNSRFKDKSCPQQLYPTMTLEELKSLNIPSAPKSHLYLWFINQHPDWAIELAKTWNFSIEQILTWKKPGLGVGRFQCNTEHVLVCRKGGRKDNAFGMSGGTIFEWPRGRHSEKPDSFYEKVMFMSPGPYLELFARKQRENWISVGYDIDGKDIRHSLQLV